MSSNTDTNTNTNNTNTSNTKIAIVTGGSRGLGRSMVLALAKDGVQTIFTYQSNRTEAEKVVAEAASLGVKTISLQLDVGQSSTFTAFVEKVQGALVELGAHRFDYLINNAGMALHKPIVDTTEEEMDAIYHVHFKGAFVLTQKLLPLMYDGGRILNISTGLARFSLPGMSVYAAMKGALEVWTRYLAKELGARGITANVVAPGAIETDFGGGAVRDNQDMNRFVAGMTALGRVGVPEDIGPMVATLLRPENRWVTGQRIEVSGGMLL